MLPMKPIEFIGGSRRALAAFPSEARRTAGFQLDRIQRGWQPNDWKPIRSVGPGAMELRVRDSAGAFRVIYVAKFESAIFVLHAFQKKSRKASILDVELARARYAELVRMHSP
jgi:phage-related protein